MADPYFHFVTAQFRATKQNSLELNSAIPYGFYARPTVNTNGNCPTITNEYTFLNPFSFKFVKPQVITLEKMTDNGTVPMDPARFFSADFTVEGRFYLLSLANLICLIECWSSTNGWKLVVNTNGTIQLQERNIAVTLVSSTGGPLVTINTPFHIALTRTGSVLRLFLNGVKVAETTLLTAHSWTTASPATLNIGGQYNTRVTTNDMDGYADDIRITRGVSRYTADFTPPVATDFSEFSLLTIGSNKYISTPDTIFTKYVSGEKKNTGGLYLYEDLNQINEIFDYSNNSGSGEIYDRLTVDDVPAVRKAILMERDSKIVVRQCRSNSNGYFHLKNIDKNLVYMLIGEDDVGSSPRKNASIRDFVKCIPKIIITRKPTSFTSGQRSALFEVRAINFDVPVTVTLGTSSDVTFSSNTITILPANKTGYFTLTPATVGSKTISFTNSVNSNNPENLTFTVT